MDKTTTKKLITAAVGFLILFALLGGIEFSPGIARTIPFALLLLPAFVLAVPILLTYIFVFSGYAYGAVVVVVCFGAAILLGFTSALYLAAAFVPLSLAASFVIVKAKRLRTSFVICSAAALVGAVATIGILTLITKMPTVDYVVAYYGEQLSLFDDAQITTLYELSRFTDLINGAVTQQAIEQTASADAILKMQDFLREALNISIVYIILMYSMALGFFTYTLPRALAKKAGMSVTGIAKFKDYALPRRFWIVALVFVGASLIGASFDLSGFDILQETLYNVFIFVFMIQGLCLLLYWIDERKMSNGKKTILIIVAVVFLQAIALPIAGLLENIMGIRARMKARKADAS